MSRQPVEVELTAATPPEFSGWREAMQKHTLWFR